MKIFSIHLLLAVLVLSEPALRSEDSASRLNKASSQALPSFERDFIISYFIGPRSDQDMHKSYREAAQCGFNFTMQPADGFDRHRNKAVFKHSIEHGMRYLVCDARFTTWALWNSGIRQDTVKLKEGLAAALKDYARQPGTGGYFISDEPRGEMLPLAAAINQYLLKNDPHHVPFINLNPIYADAKALGHRNYEDYVEACCKTVKPRILSYDNYPILDKHVLHQDYYRNMEIIRRQGLKHGIRIGLIVQAFGNWSGRVDPTESEIRGQVYSFLTYGGTAILYFSYWNQRGNPYSGCAFSYEGVKQPHYEHMRKLNRELKSLGPMLMRMKSTGVYHTGKLPIGAVPPAPGLPVRAVKDQALILGFFEHADGSRWLMVTNRDFQKPAEVTLKSDAGLNSIEHFDVERGKLVELPIAENGTVAFRLEVGSGKLLKLGRMH